MDIIYNICKLWNQTHEIYGGIMRKDKKEYHNRKLWIFKERQQEKKKEKKDIQNTQKTITKFFCYK